MKKESLKDKIIERIKVSIFFIPFILAIFWFYVQYKQTFG